MSFPQEARNRAARSTVIWRRVMRPSNGIQRELASPAWRRTTGVDSVSNIISGLILWLVETVHDNIKLAIFEENHKRCHGLLTRAEILRGRD